MVAGPLDSGSNAEGVLLRRKNYLALFLVLMLSEGGKAGISVTSDRVSAGSNIKKGLGVVLFLIVCAIRSYNLLNLQSRYI